MSLELLEFTRRFTQGKVDAQDFVERFASTWRAERDSNVALQDDTILSEKLSTIFCLADLYNPHDDRKSYELDSERLKKEIISIINNQ